MFLTVNNSKDIVTLTINHTTRQDFFVTCTVTTCQQSPFINTDVTVVISHNNNSITYSKVFNNDNTNGTRACSFQLRINFTKVHLSNFGRYTCSYFLNNNLSVELNNKKSDNADFIIKSEFFKNKIIMLLIF